MNRRGFLGSLLATPAVAVAIVEAVTEARTETPATPPMRTETPATAPQRALPGVFMDRGHVFCGITTDS